MQAQGVAYCGTLSSLFVLLPLLPLLGLPMDQAREVIADPPTIRPATTQCATATSTKTAGRASPRATASAAEETPASATDEYAFIERGTRKSFKFGGDNEASSVSSGSSHAIRLLRLFREGIVSSPTRN